MSSASNLGWAQQHAAHPTFEQSDFRVSFILGLEPRLEVYSAPTPTGADDSASASGSEQISRSSYNGSSSDKNDAGTVSRHGLPTDSTQPPAAPSQPHALAGAHEHVISESADVTSGHHLPAPEPYWTAHEPATIGDEHRFQAIHIASESSADPEREIQTGEASIEWDNSDDAFDALIAVEALDDSATTQARAAVLTEHSDHKESSVTHDTDEVAVEVASHSSPTENPWQPFANDTDDNSAFADISTEVAQLSIGHADSAPSAPESVSLWDGMFADDELLPDDLTTGLPQQPHASENTFAPAETSRDLSWDALTKEQAFLDAQNEQTAASSLARSDQELSWSNEPGFDELLVDDAAPSGPSLAADIAEQPVELNWDNAFADDDDDFLAGFEMAAAQGSQAVSGPLPASGPAHNLSQVPLSTERPRSLSNRQSYVPVDQTHQTQNASNARKPAAFAAVPAPVLPTQNSVESSVTTSSRYASPYDMPDDFAKPLPRKRTSSSQPSASYSPLSQVTTPALQPPITINSTSQTSAPHAVPKATSIPATQGFFEDLPTIARQRSSTPTGRYAPHNSQAPATSVPPPVNSKYTHTPPPTQRANGFAQHTTRPSQTPSSQQHDLSPTTNGRPTQQVSVMNSASGISSQLLAPVRISPYSDDQGTLGAAPVPSPPLSTRYSPAPASAQTIASGPAKSLTQVSRPPLQQYAPRTSSPLSYQLLSHQASSTESVITKTQPSNSLQTINHRSQSFLEPVQENAAFGSTSPSAPTAYSQLSVRAAISPPPKSGPPSVSSSPRRRGHYMSTAQSLSSDLVPPQRAQTSSPNSSNRLPRTIGNVYDRPASAQGVVSPIKSFAPSPFHAASASALAPRADAPQSAQILAPQDERVSDPLQRWRGSPVFAWGSSGITVSAFPTYLPRYVSGQAHPLMQVGGGHFKVQNMSAADILPPTILSFPGPLKKAKKKELLTWLQTGRQLLESQTELNADSATPESLEHIRLQERILLYKVLALAVEYDGNLNGVPGATEAIKAILSEADSRHNRDAAAASSEVSGQILPDASGALELAPLRNLLKTGEAEKAVWHAVDQRLWGAAFLISSTLSKEIWKQVIQEFVRKEVRDKALAALFQVFAGNWDESVDELVSVSARAGFQMVNTAAGTIHQADALAGLEKWKETVLLILSNRSPGDAQALVSIGRLLAGYGRFEAAHVCFIFAGSSGVFGGPEDPSAAFSLIGASLPSMGTNYGGNIESILLSEVYEYILTLAPIPSSCAPHLQAFKLYHAEILAENGLRNEAQSYCDALNALLHSKTNRSPYYNVTLMQAVDNLQKRLSETPLDASSSWKPSIDKVSSSLWGKFNSFVAGDEKLDSPVNGHATPPDQEQFQRFAGDTPPLAVGSPLAPTDLYGMYQPSVTDYTGTSPSVYDSSTAYAPQRTSSGTMNSRYQPSAHAVQAKAPMASPEESKDDSTSLAISSAQKDLVSLSPYGVPQASYAPASSVNGFRSSSFSGLRQASMPTNDATIGTSPVHQRSDYDDSSHFSAVKHISTVANDYDTTSVQTNHYSSFYPSSQSAVGEGLLQTQDAQAAPPSSIHEPAYQPYQYEPYAPGVSEDRPEIMGSESSVSEAPESSRTKKKSFMDDDDDDDDDLMRRVASLKQSSAPSATREPDDAVRRAAEADAARPPPTLNHKSSWFGGLGFFGKKQAEIADVRKPVKANLGEKSSFVFDPELKKWVNKAAGAESTPAVSATPPPPRSAPSRSATPASGAPSNQPLAGPPRPSSTISSAPPMSRSASFQPPESSRPSTSIGPSPAPPISRPGTAMSNASDIDDLLVSSGPRSRGAKPKKKGRYVDVMATKTTHPS